MRNKEVVHMRKIVFAILLISMVSIGCHKQLMPSTIHDTTDTLVRHYDSVVVHDTTIIYPGEDVSGKVNIDSLFKCLNDKIKKDTVLIDNRHGANRVKLSLDTKGNLTVDCKSDSLKSVIQSWVLKYSYLFTQYRERKEIPVPGATVYVNHIPKWIWYVIGTLLALLLVTNFKTIINILKVL